MSRERAEEFADKLNALVREYRDVALPPDEHGDCYMDHAEPDWDHPLSIQHWVLVFTIDDNASNFKERGYWTLSISPPSQRPYITQGLLTEYLDGNW